MSVAIKRLRQTPKVVTLGNGKKYAFVVQRNISLSWVDEKDVNTVLAIKRHCCGNNRAIEFVVAIRS